jgi:hypothetical protein
MTFRGVFLLTSVIILFASGDRTLQARETVYCLGFKNLSLVPGEGLSGFDLRVHSGILVSFPHVPIGWKILIDNETNGMPRISGTAIQQAASLDRREFATDFIRIAAIPKDEARSGIPAKITVQAELQLSHGDTKREILVPNEKVSLIPEERCPSPR